MTRVEFCEKAEAFFGLADISSGFVLSSGDRIKANY